MNSLDSGDKDVQIVLVEPQVNKQMDGGRRSKPALVRAGSYSTASKKKQSSLAWVSSSFDGFLQDGKSSFKTPTFEKSNSLPDSQIDKDLKGSLSSHHSCPESRKRQRSADNRISVKDKIHDSLQRPASSELWSQKYSPLSKIDLAVHKKKVEEIEHWLDTRGRRIIKHAAPILLVTGPPGSGKTASIKLLCAERGLTVQEWVSATDQAADQWSTEDFHSSERSRVDVYSSQSQSALFHNFLLRANKYQALNLGSSPAHRSERTAHSSGGHTQSSSQRTVIVLEDLPNIFYRDPSQFHDILRKYYYIGHSPIVFLVTESSSNSSSTQRLFPKDLQGQLHISHISVNPVAPTMLIKVLNRVVSQEASQARFVPPSPSVIESIGMSSAGDIRAALNTLQFACRQDSSDINSLSGSTRGVRGSRGRLKYSKTQRQDSNTKDQPGIASVLGAKDTSVFLFQAIGKILYFKRGDPLDTPTPPSLPQHLLDQHRDPLLVNPEEVAFKSHLPSELFTSFLHENYMDFLPEVDDLERAAAYFSDADLIAGAVWGAREELEPYSISIAARGYIHSNSDVTSHDSKRKNQGWKPMHRSQWFTTCKKARENVMTARQLFKGYHWEPEVLCTELLPFISLTNPTLHDPGQISFIQEMTQFSRQMHMFRSGLERLDEKDVVDETDDDNDTDSKPQRSRREQQQSGGILDNKLHSLDDDDNFPSASQSNVKSQEDEDDFVIEDFDD